MQSQMIQYVYSLKSYAVKLTEDADKADDLLQDLCLKYLQQQEYYQDKHIGEHKAILKQSLYHLFIDSKRRQRYTEEIDEDWQLGKEPNVYDQMEVKEVFAKVNTIKNKTHRNSLLAFVAGYSYEEIAKSHSISVNSVGGYVRYARQLV